MPSIQNVATPIRPSRPNFNLVVIGLTAFLTIVDLFATQAVLPAIARTYSASPAAASVAVNAGTIGMAIAGVFSAMISGRVDRRNVITLCLLVLAVPTVLLAYAPNLETFAALRVVQGLLMCTAFTLTLAHLGERCTVSASPAAFAAYVTGNVASNLFGRYLSAAVVGSAGLHVNFFVFAALNVLGAFLVWTTLSRSPPRATAEPFQPIQGLAAHLRTPRLLAAFVIGFCILFAFLGVFTFVNFVLVTPPLSLSMRSIGFAYAVFAPALITTPLAGGFVARYGARTAIWLGLGVTALGLPMLASPHLLLVLLGMVLAAGGAYFAQAAATGYVSRAATRDRGAASGLYLAFYFTGGLVGTAVLGGVFEGNGWAATLVGVGVALAIAAALTVFLKPTATASKP